MDFNTSETESVQKLIKLQSYFKQTYVRNEMQKVRNTFEEIFTEIEGVDSDVKIVWPLNESSICHPKFVDKKKLNKTLIAKPSGNSSAHHQLANVVPSDMLANKEDMLFDVDLNAEQMDYLSVDNLKKLSKSELLSVRENVSLEMLWIQQAIQSRMQYLQLKRNLKNQKKKQEIN